MLYRYNLKVGFEGKEVFNGSFRSINQLIKVALNFDKSCVMEAYDEIFTNIIPIYSLMSEFERDVTGI